MVAAVEAVCDPEIGRSLGELGMVQGDVVRSDRVQVSLAMVASGHPRGEQLRDGVVEAVRRLHDGEIAIDVTTMNDRDRARLRRRLQGEAPDARGVFGNARIYAIASGKGGVGKSSVATNLAVAMARRGKRVALLDADVWGFSIPRMMGVARQPLIIDGLLVPPLAHGVHVASVGLLTEESAPVIWRGPMLHKMLEQFVTDVFWDEPDVLLVDMPPGTGDVSLTVAKLLPDASAVIVTTPQPAAQRVAQRAAYMAREVNLQLGGVIENMSWFTGNDGERYELFGAGGGQLLAGELDVPLLGQLPLVPAIRAGADEGQPTVIREPDGEAALAFDAIAARLLELPVNRIRHPELRVTSTD